MVLAMRIAIPTWRGRVSPVFDAAGKLLLVDAQDGREVRREEAAIGPSDLAARANRVAELGTSVLICGAISQPLEALLASAGVQVIPQVCGPAEEVLRTFMAGQLTEQAFLMPGCCGRRRRFRHRHRGGQPSRTSD
jgi:predicted Fe-Mo cluster-binding NifX family protein